MLEKDIDVGLKLKTLRQGLGLSQRKLAKRAGVANATISQIEAGTLNPTIGALKKVLSGFPISLSEFFSDGGQETSHQIFFRIDELTELSDNGVSYKQVGRDLRCRKIQFMYERYSPGSTTGRHELAHEGEECGIVIDGELTVTVDGKTTTLRPGEAYYFESNVPHSFKNNGFKDCVVVSACTPPSF